MDSIVEPRFIGLIKMYKDMSKIKDIIQSSINVKQQVLQSEELINTIDEGCECNCRQF